MNEFETMPIECKVAGAKSEIDYYISKVVSEYGLPPFIVTGLLADILLTYKNEEHKALNGAIGKIAETITSVNKKEEKEDV